MSSYLLDTCVFSEYVKRTPNLQVIEWVDQHSPDLLFMSVITLGELKKGCFKLKQSQEARFNKLKHWIDTLENDFKDRVVPLDSKVINTWGELCGKSESNGYTLPLMDSLIGATALSYQLTLVTRNVKDFEFLSIPIINPWS